MSENVSIVVNGEVREAAAGATVTELLKALGIHGGRVAIERNWQILPRAAWSETVWPKAIATRLCSLSAADEASSE